MVEISFIENLIAEFAFAFNFVCIMVGWPLQGGRKFVLKALFGMFLLLPFYARWIHSNFIFNLIIFFGFIIYGAINSFKLIKYRGMIFAVDEYNKSPKKPKYGINDTLKRINDFVYMILLVSIFLIMQFLIDPKNPIITIPSIISFLIIFCIMTNHLTRGYIKETKIITPEIIKTNLFTLFSLTIILSFMLLILLSITLKEIFPSIINSFPFIVFFAAAPPLIVTQILLNHLRLTFFKNKEIAEIFIKNLFRFSILTIIIFVILSDIPVANYVIKNEDISGMIYWVNGFVIYLVTSLSLIYKDSLLFGLESKILNLKQIKENA